ncbi:MAG: hypothetical protein LUE17_06005 [Planctomycetaceae bacterium]|nr:hypothetical protein [Planctomycetaceae bacterium]
MPNSQPPPGRSAFYEQVAQDFTDVFLNVEEFGRLVKWNGRDLLIAEGAAPTPMEAEEASGILFKTKVVICRDKDLPRLPKVDETVNLNGENWQVLDPKPAFGHFIITLGRLNS